MDGSTSGAVVSLAVGTGLPGREAGKKLLRGLMEAAFTPDVAQRQLPILDAGTAAILFIDIQNYNCHRDGAIHRALSARSAQIGDYFWTRVDEATNCWRELHRSCRSSGVEVMYTVIQSYTRDGRDRGLDYKITGFHVPPGCWDAQVLDCIQPGDDDIVLPKTSASVFNSTNLDYLLRNLGIKQLVLCGALTDQCVESAVRDACDLNYLVTLVTDACVTQDSDRHEASLRAISGYCRQVTTADLVKELAALRSREAQA